MEVVRQSILVSQNLLKKSLFNSFSKGRKGEPVGTVKEWRGKKYKKKASGDWKEVFDPVASKLREDKEEAKYNKKGFSHLVGTTVYHGTTSKYLLGVMKYGLKLNPNKYLAKYSEGEERKRVLKELPKELYTTTSKEDAIMFAKDASYYGGKPVVFSFVVNGDDKIKNTELYYEKEVIFENPIPPERLKIEVGPEKSKLEAIVQRGRDKTGVIKDVNKILKQNNISLKSGSKTTSRVLLYKDNYFEDSFLLEEISKYLPKEVSQSDRDQILNLIPDGRG